jgi:hypothetical protein
MNLVKKWGLVLTVGCFLGAQSFDDPVMKARLQRSQAQGIEETDLPPVPRGVVEPPPLPPPETHAKDSPHARVSKSARRHGGKVRAGKRGRAAGPSPQLNSARKSRPARPAGKAARPAGKAARPAGKAARHSGKRAKA